MDENEVYQKNFGLIVSLVKDFQYSFKNNHGVILDFEDLIQIGGIGLINAMRTYIPTDECKFSTYASSCIIRTLGTELRKAKRLKRYDETKTLLSFQYLVSDEGKEEFGDMLGSDDGDFKASEDRAVIEQILDIAKRVLKTEEYELWTRYINGKGTSELADELGIKRTTMCMRINRYRDKVLNEVKDELKISNVKELIS